jgi:NADH dehydrogenase FAD-containing subunit
MLDSLSRSAHWQQFLPGLKLAEDAGEIRARVLLAFEYAETEPDPQERARLLTFVVVGENQSGLALANDIACQVHDILAEQRYAIAAEEAEVVLIESSARTPDDYGLAHDGIGVMFGAPVTGIAPDHVLIGTQRIESRTCIWADKLDALPPAVRRGSKPGRTTGIKQRFRNHALALGDRLLAYASARIGLRLIAGSR